MTEARAAQPQSTAPRLSAGDLLVMVLAIGVYLAQKLLVYKLGLNWEEGRDAQAYLRVMEGRVPYRDFNWNYGPLGPYVYALVFRVFGASLPVLRLAAIAFGTLAVGVAYLVARRLMSPIWAGVAAVFSMLLFHTAGHTYNHVFATIGTLASLLMVLKFLESGRFGFLLLSGCFTGIALLTKPIPMGAATAIANGVVLCLRSPHRVRSGLGYLVGASIVVAPVALAFGLLLWHDLLGFFGGADGRPRLLALFGTPEQVLGPWRYPNPVTLTGRVLSEAWAGSKWDLYYAAAKLFNGIVSWLPIVGPLLALPGLRASDRDRANALVALAVLAPLLFVQPLFSGGSGETGHLGDGYTHAPAFILLIYACSRIPLVLGAGAWSRAVTYAAAGAGLAVFWSFPYTLEYYNLVRRPPPTHPLALSYRPLALPRAAGIAVGAKELIEEVVGFIQTHTAPDEPIVFMHYNPMFFFLSERESLFPEDDYIFVWAGASALVPWPGPSAGAVRLVLERLEEKRPRFLFVQSMDYSPTRARQSEVWRFIDRRYVPISEADWSKAFVRVYARRE